MALFGWKRMCFVIPLRTGCLVICFIETLWACLNLYLYLRVLLHLLFFKCIHRDYYLELDINSGKT